MFYRLAGRALADRMQTQLIRISVSLGSDKLNVLTGKFQGQLKALPTLRAPEACVISSLNSKWTNLQPCAFK